ncbi:hypothetical protein DFJ77DRAFT_481232 [Powellomyces hirtus]|nr:hypothetical protein DFJ77DRAFT_481232 [Powellomyces hirtus]
MTSSAPYRTSYPGSGDFIGSRLPGTAPSYWFVTLAITFTFMPVLLSLKFKLSVVYKLVYNVIQPRAHNLRMFNNAFKLTWYSKRTSKTLCGKLSVGSPRTTHGVQIGIRMIAVSGRAYVLFGDLDIPITTRDNAECTECSRATFFIRPCIADKVLTRPTGRI